MLPGPGSPMPRAPHGIDALAHEWLQTLLYAFLPIVLTSLTLARVGEKGLSIILIDPQWLGKNWLANIMELLHGTPWPLPLHRDLLIQAGGEIYHPYVVHLALGRE
ncbi:hypothetical protein MHYP_G00299230 [Metynnis hypsauchen]